MASKNNVFYQLYSSDIKNYVESGYVCDNALNEQGTSFTINDNAGQIIDSKGNVLASIDLSNVGAGGASGSDSGSPTTGGGITEYTTNTKILQPHTAYLLQGTDFGLAYETSFFKIHKDLVDVDYFDVWANVEFDVQYNSEFHAQSCHINTEKYREKNKGSEESFIDIINAVFCEIGLPIVASLETVEKEDICGLGCCEDEDGLYVKFTSTNLGYAFNVRNFAVYPIFQDEENPDSPFSIDRVTPQDVIDAISYVQPTLYKIVDCSTTIDDGVTEDDADTAEQNTSYFRMAESGENLYMFSDPDGCDNSGEQTYFCWYNNHLFIEEAYNEPALNGFYCNRIFTVDKHPSMTSELYYYTVDKEYAVYEDATITQGYTENYDTDYWSDKTEIDHVIDKYRIHFKSGKEMQEFCDTVRNFHENGEYEQEVDYIKDYIARQAYLSNKSDDVIFEDLERWNIVEEIQEDTYKLDVYIKPGIVKEPEDPSTEYDVIPVYDSSSMYKIDCSLYLYILDNLAAGIKNVVNSKNDVYNYKATYCYSQDDITRSEFAYGHLIDADGVVKRNIECKPVIADASLSSWLELEVGPGETAKLVPGLHAISWEFEGKDIDPDQWKDEGLAFQEPKEGVDYKYVFCHIEEDGSVKITVSVPVLDEEGEEIGCIDVTYNPKELVEVFKQISETSGVYDMDDDSHKVYFLYENLDMRIEPLKYPNGAMRGIIIAPEYADGYIDSCKPLKVNHIKDYVYVYEAVEQDSSVSSTSSESENYYICNKFEDACSKNILYHRHEMKVLCALQTLDEKRVSGLNFKCGKLANDVVSQSNDWSFEAQIAPYQHYEELSTMDANDSWSTNDFTNNPDNFRDTHDRISDKNYMGMYGYLKWVEDNDMWTEMKTFYGVVAGVDSLDNNETNLVRSLYLFNPNDIPVKCHYMIFS